MMTNELQTKPLAGVHREASGAEYVTTSAQHVKMYCVFVASGECLILDRVLAHDTTMPV